jgi:hypothetical protein
MIDALLNNLLVVAGALGALAIALLTSLGTKFIERYFSIRPAFYVRSPIIGPNVTLTASPANRAARKKRDLGISVHDIYLPIVGKLHVDGTSLSWTFDLSRAKDHFQILEEGEDYPVRFFFDAGHQSDPTPMLFKSSQSSPFTPLDTQLKSTSGKPEFTSSRPALSEKEFFELLGWRNAHLPDALKAFLAKAKALGVYVDIQGGLNLKHPFPGNALNLGTIRKDGYVDTGPSTWWGRTDIGRRYNDALAKRIGGSVQSIKAGKESAVRTANGRTPLLSDFLPQHEEHWLQAMQQYIGQATELVDRGIPLLPGAPKSGNISE